MEIFELLIGLVVLAVPIAAVAGFIMALNTRDRIRRLEVRLAWLEQRLAEFPAHSAPEAPVAPPIAEEAAPPAAPDLDQTAAPPPEETPETVPPVSPEPEEAPVPEAAPEPPPFIPQPRHAGFEERFGTQWVVWVGGLALALGGLFLVRYSIEEGLIGPGARIALGGLLAAALLFAGEWTRRREIATGIIGLPAANIPSMLTAASTVVAYGTIYAAYGIYEFLSPAAAFVLLGLAALLTLAAALLHGPALAGIGLIGAYLTPALVATEAPDFWALYIYLAIVTAAAFALARMRLWRWLAVGAVVLATLWSFAGIDVGVTAIGAHAFHVLAGFILAALLIVSGLAYGPDADPGRIDAISSGALAAFLFAAMVVVLASDHDPVTLTTFTLLIAATIAVVWRTDAAAAAVPIAALFTALVFAEWALDFDVVRLIAPAGPTAGTVPEPAVAYTGWHLVLGAALAGLFGAAGFLAQGRSETAVIPILWSAAAAFAPLAILAALYYRVAGFERSIPFAALALLLAALDAWATDTLLRRAPRPGIASASAIFATGTVAALALALTFALERGWLTVALALMVPGIAWIADKRPAPLLRWLAAAVVLLVVARIIYEPRIVGTDVGTTPIFNWLLYGYGIPATAFWYAGIRMRRRADDVPSRIVDAAAILFTVLLAFLEIRHLIYRGDIYRPNTDLAELALQVCVGLALTIGLERLRLRSGSVIHDAAAHLLAIITLLGIVIGLGIFENPLLTEKPIGRSFFNLILLGYGLPALLTATLALVTRGHRQRYYAIVATITAVALALVYLTLEVRRLYHGPVLGGPTPDAEQYTYSAVWLGFGVLLLIAGFLLRSQPARLCSAAVVVLTVAKIFLVDMSELTGVYRALSFIGLGLVLVGIGWLYQRMLFRAPGNQRQPA